MRDVVPARQLDGHHGRVNAMDTRRSSYVPGERERAEYDLIHQRLDERPAIDDDYWMSAA